MPAPDDFSGARDEFALRCPPERLIGLSVDDARVIVEAAGGTFRPVREGEAITADLRSNRITARVADHRVIEAAIT